MLLLDESNKSKVSMVLKSALRARSSFARSKLLSRLIYSFKVSISSNSSENLRGDLFNSLGGEPALDALGGVWKEDLASKLLSGDAALLAGEGVWRISLLLSDGLTGVKLSIRGAGARLGLVLYKLLLAGEADKGRLIEADGVNDPWSLDRMPVSAFIRDSLNSKLLSLPSSS